MEFRKGYLPLWDAYTGCGTPQLANSQSACLYPPFWFWNLTGLSHWFVWMSLLPTSIFRFGSARWTSFEELSSRWIPTRGGWRM
ncbi:MAG TPA: hypothetical protein VIJ93_03430 [bacterium]